MSKGFQYVDIHGHLNFADYDADRQDAIRRAHEAGVAMITVGTDLASSKRALELAEAHEHMWATVGLHPVHAGESHHGAREPFDREAFRELAAHPKAVAIGECGLDFFHSKPKDIARQREIFVEHIKLANEAGKPLMLHVRNGKSSANAARAGSDQTGQISAYRHVADILKEHARVRADFHFFAGDADDVRAAIPLDCAFSFTGVITFARDYDDVINAIPIERIMSETDCPYVSPAPHRGKRNEPSYVIEVVKTIARIRGGDEGKIARQLLQNAADFFRI